MSRKKTFSVVTVTRNESDNIIGIDVTGDLDEDGARKLLASNSDEQHQRLLFAGNLIPWAPSVSIGAPRKRRASGAKPDEKKRGEKPRNGTRFNEDGAKAAPQQGENNANGA